MELSDEILENNFPDQVYSPAIPLRSSKAKLKCRIEIELEYGI